ncbi:MAG: response regulator [Steroidobacteraceae bacterium]
MQDTVTTSWRRLSDRSRKHPDSGTAHSAQVPPVHVTESQQLETWQDEGGQPELSTQPVRILIVDNDINSSGSLELMLQALGHPQTRVAYSGHAALAIAADFQPSVVLLELNLLDMSGFEVARLLREQARSHDLRLIALTSGCEHAGRELARVAGFERYLLKPVAVDDLSGLLQMQGKSVMNHPARLASPWVLKQYPLRQKRSVQP